MTCCVDKQTLRQSFIYIIPNLRCEYSVEDIRTVIGEKIRYINKIQCRQHSLFGLIIFMPMLFKSFQFLNFTFADIVVFYFRKRKLCYGLYVCITGGQTDLNLNGPKTGRYLIPWVQLSYLLERQTNTKYYTLITWLICSLWRSRCEIKEHKVFSCYWPVQIEISLAPVTCNLYHTRP